MAPKKLGFDPAKATVPIETNEGTDAVLERGRTNPKPQAGQRKQIGVKIPLDLYNNLESLKTARKLYGETLTLTDLIVDFLTDYMDQHMDEITDMEEMLAQSQKKKRKQSGTTEPTETYER